jgi:hypothetical protein
MLVCSWLRCAAHAFDLALEDIAKEDWAAEVNADNNRQIAAATLQPMPLNCAEMLLVTEMLLATAAQLAQSPPAPQFAYSFHTLLLRCVCRSSKMYEVWLAT